jgi:hypothetical protein
MGIASDSTVVVYLTKKAYSVVAHKIEHSRAVVYFQWSGQVRRSWEPKLRSPSFQSRKLDLRPAELSQTGTILEDMDRLIQRGFLELDQTIYSIQVLSDISRLFLFGGE